MIKVKDLDEDILNHIYKQMISLDGFEFINNSIKYITIKSDYDNPIISSHHCIYLDAKNDTNYEISTISRSEYIYLIKYGYNTLELLQIRLDDYKLNVLINKI